MAHIFAVSGLNIGIIYGLMLIPLKKFRVRAAVRVPVVAAALLFYTGVCGFSASPVRAAVMCAALSLSDANGMKYDALNSVSFAALAVMLVNPVYFYQVGFRLSVAATGGLIVLGGAAMGHLRGTWHIKPTEALKYYDTIYHMRRYHGKVLLLAGLGDYVCPPFGMAKIFAEAQGPKEIIYTQSAGHNGNPKGEKISQKSVPVK